MGELLIAVILTAVAIPIAIWLTILSNPGVEEKYAIKGKQEIDFSLFNKLKHIITSHHLLKEWDSAREPAIPEAWLVYTADQISSKIGGEEKILNLKMNPN